MSQYKFPPGRTVATTGVAAFMESGGNYLAVLDCVARHLKGDWGEVCAEDAAANNAALQHGARLLSAYTVAGTKIWVITEADRSVTTVLFPEEY